MGIQYHTDEGLTCPYVVITEVHSAVSVYIIRDIIQFADFMRVSTTVSHRKGVYTGDMYCYSCSCVARYVHFHIKLRIVFLSSQLQCIYVLQVIH